MRQDPDVTPDTKDWTWVLGTPCPDCGYDAGTVGGSALGDLTRTGGRAWQQVLAGADVRTRPATGVWSPLEYACHVADVYRVFDGRLVLMLAEDDPAFANWDQDRTALENGYGEQDPGTVSEELAAAADSLAARFDRVPDDGWGRTARRSDGAVFTVVTLGRYLTHDWVHHLHDVGGHHQV